MKMVSFALAVFLSTALLFSGRVYALDECSISGTSPGSTNQCVLETECSVDIDNNNDIVIDNNNGQTSGSGDGTVEGNTGGGGATSGGATNGNSTEVEVDINNGGVACVAAPAAPTPPEGGRGAGQVSGVSTTAVAGGRGAGEQVAAPVGGVGAGAGGLAVPAVAVSLLTALVGARRLHRQINA